MQQVLNSINVRKKVVAFVKHICTMLSTMKIRRVIRKDEYVGVRMPRADRERLETMAREVRRDPSDLVWVLMCEGLDRLQRIRQRTGDSNDLLGTTTA